MALLKRRAAATEPAAGTTPVDTPDAAGKVVSPATPAERGTVGNGTVGNGTVGKGRRTPKRSEARAARTRGSVATPASGKAGRARAREERRRQTQEYRAAMLAGDVNRLPPRERVPERVLARDFVDSRRNIGPFFLAVAAVYFVGGIVPNTYVRAIATYLMLVGIVAVLVDSLVLSRQVTRRVAEKYPGSRVRVRAYAVQRALLPPRWRMPRPRAKS